MEMQLAKYHKMLFPYLLLWLKEVWMWCCYIVQTTSHKRKHHIIHNWAKLCCLMFLHTNKAWSLTLSKLLHYSVDTNQHVVFLFQILVRNAGWSQLWSTVIVRQEITNVIDIQKKLLFAFLQPPTLKGDTLASQKTIQWMNAFMNLMVDVHWKKHFDLGVFNL